MSAPTPTAIPIPDYLDADELAEWLAGAGFTPHQSITLRGDTCTVYAATTPTPGWSEYVTVVTERDGTVAHVGQYPTEDVLPHDDLCGCDWCRGTNLFPWFSRDVLEVER